jgi:hypothetical protein
MLSKYEGNKSMTSSIFIPSFWDFSSQRTPHEMTLDNTNIMIHHRGITKKQAIGNLSFLQGYASLMEDFSQSSYGDDNG